MTFPLQIAMGPFTVSVPLTHMHKHTHALLGWMQQSLQELSTPSYRSIFLSFLSDLQRRAVLWAEEWRKGPPGLQASPVPIPIPLHLPIRVQQVPQAGGWGGLWPGRGRGGGRSLQQSRLELCQRALVPLQCAGPQLQQWPAPQLQSQCPGILEAWRWNWWERSQWRGGGGGWGGWHSITPLWGLRRTTDDWSVGVSVGFWSINWFVLTCGNQISVSFHWLSAI